MSTPEERIAILLAAYLWEQDRLKAWKNEAKGTLGMYPKNEMITAFHGTWDAYIDAVMASNQWIIDCLKKPKVKSLDALIAQIDNKEHKKAAIVAVRKASHKQRKVSHYFKSLDQVIGLEDKVRDYIEAFLTTGKKPPV